VVSVEDIEAVGEKVGGGEEEKEKEKKGRENRREEKMLGEIKESKAREG
jgi:hypothetical protein